MKPNIVKTTHINNNLVKDIFSLFILLFIRLPRQADVHLTKGIIYKISKRLKDTLKIIVNINSMKIFHATFSPIF